MKSYNDNPAGSFEKKSLLLTKVSVIMGVSGNFKDRQSPLEDMLHNIVSDEKAVDASSLHARYTEICDTMIDGLVDASDFPGFVSDMLCTICVIHLPSQQSVVNCIKTVYLFAAAYPAIISGPKASTLLPYLKNPTTVRVAAFVVFH